MELFSHFVTVKTTVLVPTYDFGGENSGAVVSEFVFKENVLVIKEDGIGSFKLLNIDGFLGGELEFQMFIGAGVGSVVLCRVCPVVWLHHIRDMLLVHHATKNISYKEMWLGNDGFHSSA